MNLKIKNQSGNALVMTLIGALILGIVIAGMATFMSNMSTIQAVTQRKGDAQNMESLIRTSMLSEESCKSVMRLQEIASDTTNPLLNISQSELAKIGTSQNPQISVSALKVAGDTISTSTTNWNGKFNVTGIQIELRQQTSATLKQYVGWLKTDVNSSVAGTTVSRQLVAPIWLKLEANDPASPTTTTYKLSSCMVSSAEVDPETTCINMGGRWLTDSVTDPAIKKYNSNSQLCQPKMSQDRCSFGNTISLVKDEVPAGIPCDGTANSLGERATICYYQKPNTTYISQFSCRSSSNGKIKKCVFNESTQRWELALYKGSPNTYDSTILTCDKGVEISRTPDSLISCDKSTGLRACAEENSEKIPNTTGISGTNATIRLLPAIEICKPDLDSEKYYSCSNSSDPQSAFLGKKGSCVFRQTDNVNGTWIYVKVGKKFSAVGANIKITQPTGIECEEVQLNANMVRQNNFKIFTSTFDATSVTPGNKITELYCSAKINNDVGDSNFDSKILKCGNDSDDAQNDLLDDVGNINTTLSAPNAFSSGNICWKIKSNLKTSINTSYSPANSDFVLFQRIIQAWDGNQGNWQDSATPGIDLEIKNGGSTSWPNYIPCNQMMEENIPPSP